MKIQKENFVKLTRRAWQLSGESPRGVEMPQVRAALYHAFYQAGVQCGFSERDLQASLSHMPYQRILLYSCESGIALHGTNRMDGNHRYYIPGYLSPRGKIALLHVLAAERAGLGPDYERTPENMACFYVELLQTAGENRASLLGNGCLKREDLHEIKWRLKRARRQARFPSS